MHIALVENDLLSGVAFTRCPGSMCGRLCTVAAEGHATPSPGVGLCPVEKQQGARLALAGADQAEVLVAHQICDRLRERLQELLGRRPSPHPIEAKGMLVEGRCNPGVATGLDLPVRIASSEQVIQRTQFRCGFRPEFSPCMARDESTQPFAQGSGPLGDLVQFLTGALIPAESGRVGPLDRACFLEPFEEFDSIAEPVRPDAERRGSAVDEIQGQMIAGKKGWRSRSGTGRQVFHLLGQRTGRSWELTQ
jgi:hypothetical protein